MLNRQHNLYTYDAVACAQVTRAGEVASQRSDPSSKRSIKFSVGLEQPAYASVRDMSVQTVHRAGKQSTLLSPTFRSSPDEIDDILAARQPISVRTEVDPQK